MSDVKRQVKKALSEKRGTRPPALKFKKIVNQVREELRPLEELVQCGICLEKLTDPRMLSCQHTFCLACLTTHFIAKNLIVRSNSQNSEQVALSSTVRVSTKCPICQTQIDLEKGYESLAKLPKNLYIESLLKLLEADQAPSPLTPVPMDYRCVKCQTVSEQQEHVCQHCMQIFCPICWNEHILELDSNLSLLIKQIEESSNRLKHKAEHYSSQCEQLKETVKESVEQKVKSLRAMEKTVINEVDMIKTQGNVRYENINGRIGALREKIDINILNKNGNSRKITTYMNLHRETADLFKEIYHYGEARLIFDSDKFRIEQATEGIYNELDDKDTARVANVENPFESPSSMMKHYKSRSFVPKLVWTKCPRPGGVSICPWDSSKIYIAATDSRNIYILDRSKFKLTGRIAYEDMMCPTSIAFSKITKEIFVTDKWSHSVHVFSGEGKYVRSGCSAKLRSPDGVAMGPNEELIVCDTGNNRLVVVDSKTGELVSTIGSGELSMPSSVAVHGGTVLVADTGNNRVKRFSPEGTLLQEIGCFGSSKGQFKSPEVVAVDCLGFIFVGDAGNARIQVFQPDGSFAKIFGSKEGFGWISGICVTPELDIITADSKNKYLKIF